VDEDEGELEAEVSGWGSSYESRDSCGGGRW
jgi:hypothetical protein